VQGLTSEATLKEVQKIVDMSFSGNSVIDNIVYQLATSLNTPDFYEYMHQVISHSLPIKFADAITDFMILRNDRIYRGALEESNKSYNNIIECLEDTFKIFDDISKQLSVAIDASIDNDDKPVEDFLRSFYVSIATLYWKQLKMLLEAAKRYDADGILSSFNKDFKSYLIITE
jgi:hypothetical protein